MFGEEEELVTDNTETEQGVCFLGGVVGSPPLHPRLPFTTPGVAGVSGRLLLLGALESFMIYSGHAVLKIGPGPPSCLPASLYPGLRALVPVLG